MIILGASRWIRLSSIRTRGNIKIEKRKTSCIFKEKTRIEKTSERKRTGTYWNIVQFFKTDLKLCLIKISRTYFKKNLFHFSCILTSFLNFILEFYLEFSFFLLLLPDVVWIFSRRGQENIRGRESFKRGSADTSLGDRGKWEMKIWKMKTISSLLVWDIFIMINAFIIFFIIIIYYLFSFASIILVSILFIFHSNFYISFWFLISNWYSYYYYYYL